MSILNYKWMLNTVEIYNEPNQFPKEKMTHVAGNMAQKVRMKCNILKQWKLASFLL